MDSALRDTTWTELADRVENARETIAHKRKLEAMLRKVEEERATVPDHIYQKVQGEYRSQLDDIVATLEPIRKEITEARESVSLEIGELDRMIERTRDNLSELQFRFKVGEFDEAMLKEKQQPLQESLEQHTASKQTLTATLATFEAFADTEAVAGDTPDAAKPEPERSEPAVAAAPEPDGDEPRIERQPDPDPHDAAETPDNTDAGIDLAGDSPQPDSCSKPEEPGLELEREPEKIVPDTKSTTDAGEAQADTSFVNPNEWLDDFTDESKKKPVEAAAPPATNDADKFESLLDDTFPGTATDTAAGNAPQNDSNQSAAPAEPSSDTTPMLVMKTQSGAEKRIPVLPITLTIGREHDNNIEIKDEDVARYHARIVHKNGEYFLEALDTTRTTLVNGKHVTESILQAADSITIGKTKLFFMME